MKPLLQVDDLRVEFSRGHQKLQAVAGVTFTIYEGETLGLVGESGCGKSTTGRAIVQVERPTSGTVRFDGLDLTGLSGLDLRQARRGVQMIFQDPVSSLNPRRRVGKIVAEPLDTWKRGTPEERAEKVREMLIKVGLNPDTVGDRRPREFSGGQCQRISIARTLIMEPQLIVCDEIVSALDVSVQAQILNLLEDLKEQYGLTLLFIAHDLAVVKNVSDRVAVMYLGRICELAPSDDLYENPAHPYTSALMAAVVQPDPNAAAAPPAVIGEPPSPINPPSGCRFRTRCPKAQDRCAEEVPAFREIVPGHFVACHFPLVGAEAPARVAVESSTARNLRRLMVALVGPDQAHLLTDSILGSSPSSDPADLAKAALEVARRHHTEGSPLTEMTAEDRELLGLVSIMELSDAEAASLLGIPQASVATRSQTLRSTFLQADGRTNP